MMYEYTETKIVKKQIEILPCPFCGSNNVKPIHNNGDWGYSPSTDYVTCTSCCASSGKIKDSDCGNNMDLAIKKWNRRSR